MMNRGVSVTVSERVIEDIAMLKQSHADLRRCVDEGNSNMSTAMKAVDSRLETMTELLQTVARIAERQEAHGNGLDRAFSEIRGVREYVDGRADAQEEWQIKHAQENAAVERKLSLWHGVALGVSLCSGLVVGLLVWTSGDILNGFREDIRRIESVDQRHDERLDRLERIEARYHAE